MRKHPILGALAGASALPVASLAAIAALGTPGRPARTPAPSRPGLYLLAATPQIHGAYAFPVTLYRAGSGGRLRKARTIFRFAGGYSDVRGDGKGRIYVVDEGGVSIIHEDDPERPDLVLAPGPENRRDASVLNWGMCGYWEAWGVAGGPGRSSAAVFADSKHCTGPGLAVVRVAGDAQPGSPRVRLAGWALYRNYRYYGPGGGPGQWLTPWVKLSAGSLGEPMTLEPGPPKVAISSAPPSLGRVAARPAPLIAATPRWFAFRAPLPGHAGGWPKWVYVRNRRTGRWFTLKLPYMEIPPRLFGDWLCTIVQEPNPNGLPSPGEQNERVVGLGSKYSLPYPDIRGGYSSATYMPGVLELRNLATGRVVKIFTGQQDSEVLGVAADGRVAYRVNDRVLVARMRGRGVGPAALAAEGPDVPEVHWIFCRGGGDIGACLPRPPSGAAAQPRNEVQHNPRASR